MLEGREGRPLCVVSCGVKMSVWIEFRTPVRKHTHKHTLSKHRISAANTKTKRDDTVQSREMASRGSALGCLLQRTLRSLAPQHPAPVCSRQCSSKLATRPERKPKVCPVDFVCGCFWWTVTCVTCQSTIRPPPCPHCVIVRPFSVINNGILKLSKRSCGQVHLVNVQLLPPHFKLETVTVIYQESCFIFEMLHKCWSLCSNNSQQKEKKR